MEMEPKAGMGQPSYFDIRYPLASVSITNGGVSVATTMSDYFGLKIISVSAAPTIRVYDAVATTAGRLLDIIAVGSNTSSSNILYTPIRARKGIYCFITTGTGCEGMIMFAPKG